MFLNNFFYNYILTKLIKMKDKLEKIVGKVESGHLEPKEAVSELLVLFDVSQQRKLFNAILDFSEDLPLCSEDYNRDTLYKRYIAENCG